ncbi:MAG TPA: CBS domain-containing protein [Polyangiaceae bacterium]|nr:CBS domain-containing protein [Polyangiaceae bacterium]
MNISEVMTRNVRSCSAGDHLDYAARLMWENDCGCVPVVDGEGRVTAMLTDRDICMAAYTQNQPLSQIPVSTASSRGVFFARAGDSVETAERLMQMKQVRRIPIVDDDQHLVGILSLNDLARAQHSFGRKAHNGLSTDSIADTIAAIGEPRTRPTMTA